MMKRRKRAHDSQIVRAKENGNGRSKHSWLQLSRSLAWTIKAKLTNSINGDHYNVMNGTSIELETPHNKPRDIWEPPKALNKNIQNTLCQAMSPEGVSDI